MADLAKYGEVKTVSSSHSDAAEHVANSLLSQGWELLTVKVVEVQFRAEVSLHDSYIKKDDRTVYVLGKPRAKT